MLVNGMLMFGNVARFFLVLQTLQYDGAQMLNWPIIEGKKLKLKENVACYINMERKKALKII